MQVTILEHLGDSYYKVRLYFDNAYLDLQIEALETLIADATAQHDALAPKVADKKNLWQQATAALNTYLATTAKEVYVQDPTELNRLSNEAFAKLGEYQAAVREQRLYELKHVAAEKDKANLQKFSPDTIDTFAWCVNYNTGLSGDQEALVVDYHLLRDIRTDQIKNDTGLWLAANTTPPASQLVHPLATSQFACWFNVGVLPAAQRHKGYYRIATLTSIDYEADTCNLTFTGRYDVDQHALQQLIDDKPLFPQFENSGTQQMNYTGAEIYYPPCNAKAFDVGDKVIVDLGGGALPTVIGFYDNPKQCLPTEYEYQLMVSKWSDYSFGEILSATDMDNPWSFNPVGQVVHTFTSTENSGTMVVEATADNSYTGTVEFRDTRNMLYGPAVVIWEYTSSEQYTSSATKTSLGPFETQIERETTSSYSRTTELFCYIKVPGHNKVLMYRSSVTQLSNSSTYYNGVTEESSESFNGTVHTETETYTRNYATDIVTLVRDTGDGELVDGPVGTGLGEVDGTFIRETYENEVLIGTNMYNDDMSVGGGDQFGVVAEVAVPSALSVFNEGASSQQEITGAVNIAGHVPVYYLVPNPDF